MADKTKSMARGAVTIVLFAMLTKVLGFVRVSVMAAFFGATAQTDVYTMAAKVPGLVFTFLNAIVVATFIPIYTKLDAERSREEANRFASRMMNLVLVIAAAVVVLGMVFAPQIMSVLAFDYEGQKMADTVAMVRIMTPMLLMQAVAIVCMNILNANRRFGGPQLYGMPLSLCIILACVFLSRSMGAYALAWATLAAAVLQMLLLLFLARKDFRWQRDISPRDDSIRQVIRLAGPAVLSTSVLEVNNMLDTMLSSGLADGHLAALEYANRLIALVLGTVIVAAHTTSYTQLSEKASANDKDGFTAILSQNLAILIMVLLPIVLVSGINASEIVATVYERGSFNAVATSLTSGILIFYAPYLLFSGVRDVGNRAFYALGNTKIPMVSGIISMGTNAVLNVILVRPMGIYGLALATAIAMLVAAVLLLIQLRKKTGHLGFARYRGEYLRMLLAGAVCAALLVLVQHLVPGMHPFIRLCLCCAAALSAYVAVLYLTGSVMVRELVHSVLAKVKSRLVRQR